MNIRQKIPTSQLIDDTGVLVYPGWMLAGLCLAGAAKAIGPPFEAFYPPGATPFGAGWSLARFFSQQLGGAPGFIHARGWYPRRSERPPPSFVVELGSDAHH